MVDYIREDKLWRWANEDGAIGNASVGGTKNPPLKVTEEEPTTEMPTGFRVIFLTVAPIAISAIAAILAITTRGPIQYVWGGVSFIAFIWFAVQFAWVDEKRKLTPEDDV